MIATLEFYSTPTNNPFEVHFIKEGFKNVETNFLAALILASLFPLQIAWASKTGIILLAAGLGSRMQSNLPKVLYPIQDGR